MHLKVYSSGLETKRISFQRELRRVTLVVLPGTTSVDASLTIQALKTANAVAGYSAFHCRIATLDGAVIDLEDGFVLHRLGPFHALAVQGGRHGVPRLPSRQLWAAVIRAAPTGALSE